jgi:enediyne biosynthesis protein E4
MTRRVLFACLVASTAIAAVQGVPPTKRLPPPSPHAAPGVTYRDVTNAAGLSSFKHVSGTPDKNYIIEATGSGVAFWDFDNDGFVDIYLVNGSTLDRVQRGEPAPSAALLRNNGDGRFTDVTSERGVANGRWGQGVCVGDFDNDGFEDFYVTNFGKNRLYRNDRGRAFTDVAEAAHVTDEGWSTGCAFGDYDGDGWLDLFVAGYVDLDLSHLPPPANPAAAPETGAAPDAARTSTDAASRMGASYSPGAARCTYRSERVMCGPRGLKGAPDHLYRNNRDGTFTDVSVEAGVADRQGLYGFGVAWFDLDDDGRLDLFVANDSGPNYLYRNLGSGRFEDVSYASGAALDAQGREQAHMGVAVGDYDNDGRDDLHVTNFSNDFNVLYRNDDGRSFSDVTTPVGLTEATTPFLGWGTDFLDYDNDGWLDLLVVNGHVYPAADHVAWNTSYAQRALLFRNLAGKRFEDLGAAAGEVLATPRSSRGSAIGDIDNDGGIDIAINNLDDRPTVAKNDGGAKSGHWLTIGLKGDPTRRCPKDAIGSVVFVTAGGVRHRAEVASGRGQLSQSDLRVHVGLGAATTVSSLQVRWANGPTVSYPVEHIDTIITIDQASGAVTNGTAR